MCWFISIVTNELLVSKFTNKNLLANVLIKKVIILLLFLLVLLVTNFC
jgi:hypothetical protein